MDRDDEPQEDESFVEEAGELAAIVKTVTDSHGAEASAMYPRFRRILGKYQEQPQLLDGHLEGFVVPLATLLRQQAILQQSSNTATVQAICRLLNVLVLVRGHKTVVKFFPHEAADLERVISVLKQVKADAEQPGMQAEESSAWEAQSVLLLWLSILIIIPFDLSTVDSNSAASRSQGYTALAAELLGMCKEYLQHPGSAREMAALLLGRMLTRPDMGAALQDFLAWVAAALPAAQGPEAVFLVPGILKALATSFKLGHRERLLPAAPRVWALLSGLEGSPGVAGHVLARLLATKLCQRLAMVLLQQRLAPWRYTKASVQLAPPAAGAGAAAGAAAPVAGLAAAEQEAEEAEQEYDIAEEVEEVIAVLLSGLQDRDTVVRWSAAKGVGRVTGCLPRELGEEVVASVMELFRPTESDTAWHGGCLALAELARRGLLLPDTLPQVVPIVQKALAYDVRRGPHSIGSHVRDAAAYMCWAAARAYAPELLTSHVEALAASLLTTACYDREVNCRRAAAAAFQECVGRLGSFPHGIPLMAITDYFSVGNLNNAYLQVAPQVAAFPEYKQPLAQHLLGTRLRHWEKGLRELAAKALAALVPTQPAFFATAAMDQLLPLCLDPVLEVRHGAMVAVAQLLPALAAGGEKLSSETQALVAGVVPAVEKGRLLRGKGGELMREAVCKLVRSMAAVCLPLSEEQHAQVLAVLDDSARLNQEVIQAAAVRALHSYTRAYCCSAAAVQRYQPAVQQYISRLHDPTVATRRGCTLSLGTLPAAVLLPGLQQVVLALCAATVPEEVEELRDVESRASAVGALGRVCQEVWGSSSSSRDGSSSSSTRCEGAPAAGAAAAAAAAGDGTSQVQLVMQHVVPSLMSGLQDYSTDNRGDVGSWVREAALKVLGDVILLLQQHEQAAGAISCELSAAATAAVGQMLKQAVERIARIRGTASQQVKRLLSVPALAAAVPGASAVLEALPVEGEEQGAVTSIEAVPKIASLMLFPAYLEPVLEGLVASIGGVDVSLHQAALQALKDIVQQQKKAAAAAAAGGRASSQAAAISPPAERLSGDAFLQALAAALLSVWRRQARTARMAIPLIRTAKELLAKSSMQGLQLPDGSSFAAQVLELTRAEARQCPDVSRLLTAVDLIAYMATVGEPCRSAALQSCLALLVNKYPRVRRSAAELLFTWAECMEPAGAGAGAGGPAAAGEARRGGAAAARGIEAGSWAHRVQQVLEQGVWDGSLDVAKAARDQVADVLGVAVVRKEGAGGKAARSRAATKQAAGADENSSYQSLIDDFARGFGF